MTREEKIICKHFLNDADKTHCCNEYKLLMALLEREPTPRYKAFAEWVATEIFGDMWEENKDAFAEIACRKLEKLGLVKGVGDRWVLIIESEEQT